MTTPSAVELRSAVTDIVQRSALYLDERRFGDWFELLASDFVYRIRAHSPELRKEMLWLEHDRAGMKALVDLLPKHHTRGGQWLRQVVVGTVQADVDDSVRARSSLAVFETPNDVGDSHVEGGSTRLFFVGRYDDRFRPTPNGELLLAERTVQLHTRQLGIGSHLFP